MLVCGFFMCMNLANVYIVLDEGLEKRAEVILTREEAEELNKYFHYDFLNADPALARAFDGTSVYDDYTITDFEYELTIESLWSCRGTTTPPAPSWSGSRPSRARSSPAVPTRSRGKCPSDGGRYDITLVKEDGDWKIRGMQLVTQLLEPDETTDGKLTEALQEE